MSEFVTIDYLMKRFPPASPPKNSHVADPISHATYEGKYGSISWMGSPKTGSLHIWINGGLVDTSELTIQRLLLICTALGVELPKVDFDSEISG